MKIKINYTTLEMFGNVCTYGIQQEFEDSLFQTFFRNALQSLILKLARAKMRIRKAYTLQITPGEAIAYKWCIEMYNEALPNSPEYHISKEYFITPVTKQLLP